MLIQGHSFKSSYDSTSLAAPTVDIVRFSLLFTSIFLDLAVANLIKIDNANKTNLLLNWQSQ